MFDFEPGKLIIIGIVALIVIGPKDLPRVMRQLGQAVAKLRRMAAEFRGQFMEAMHDAEIEDMKADVGKLAESAKISAGLDPLAEIKAGITSALEAADKPVALPVPPAIAAPGEANSSLNSIALPRLAGSAGKQHRNLSCGGRRSRCSGTGKRTRFRPQGARRRHGCRDAGACRCAQSRDGTIRASRRREDARQGLPVPGAIIRLHQEHVPKKLIGFLIRTCCTSLNLSDFALKAPMPAGTSHP